MAPVECAPQPHDSPNRVGCGAFALINAPLLPINLSFESILE
jgi:hypothetical protein